MVSLSPLAKSTVAFAVGLAALALTPSSANALPWVLSSGSQALTNPVTPLTGGFTLDDESLANPTVTFSNVMAGSLSFGAVDVVNISISGGVTAIDWLDSDFNLLSLVFDSPLTSSGGTVALNSAVSSFTPFSSGAPAVVTGSVIAIPEPLTLLGAGAAITLGGLFKRRLS